MPSDIDVGEYHSVISDDDMEREEDDDSTPELLVLEQAPGCRNNGEATTASIGVGAPGSSNAGGSTSAVLVVPQVAVLVIPKTL